MRNLAFNLDRKLGKRREKLYFRELDHQAGKTLVHILEKAPSVGGEGNDLQAGARGRRDNLSYERCTGQEEGSAPDRMGKCPWRRD